MTALTEYISSKDNLLPISAMLTGGFLLLIFALAQILAYTTFKPEPLQKKLEIRELVKLSFKPKGTKTPRNNFLKRNKSLDRPKAKVSKVEQPQARPTRPTVDVAALMQGLQKNQLISRKNSTNRKSARPNVQQVAAISTSHSRTAEEVDLNSLLSDLSNRPSSFTAGRKAVSGGTQGPVVSVGGGPSAGSVSNVDGSALAGRATVRTSRSSGTGSGGPTISLPAGSPDGGDAALDLHALIKWMKEHPGAIPKLVQHEMGHAAGDLASAATFKANNRTYHLYLSCNEVELLLRICLVEENKFTLLKDNGIREESNYLTVGDVVRNNGKIQSLISSRKAPEHKAAAFYSIFWSWWQQQLR
ncbi:MAG: hypothetical protein ACE5HO_01590 [bacterium]